MHFHRGGSEGSPDEYRDKFRNEWGMMGGGKVAGPGVEFF